jgi:hypothetical protein
VAFERIHRAGAVSLFLVVNNQAACRPRLFSGSEIDLEVALAAMEPAESARPIDGRSYCAAGVHEELAVLPLSGAHPPAQIVAPFFAPMLRARAEYSTTAELWAIGRASAAAWIARSLRARRHVLDEEMPLAA